MCLPRPLLLLALALLLGCCKKDKDPTPLERLPPPTTEGKNTWGCLVNGEAWTASGRQNMRADWTTSSLCYASMFFSSRTVTIGLTEEFTSGSYSLVSTSGDSAFADLRVPAKRYYSDSIRHGELIITRLDRQAGIMAGTFAFTIVGGPGDTLRVTDGRFDIGNMER